MSGEILSSTTLQQLYETDFAEWLDTTAQLLKQRRFTELDLDNLIEEIEALGRSDKREIRSRLIKLLSHLLKYTYQPEKRSKSWISTILEQRRQISLVLEDSPSLKNYVTEVFVSCYERARRDAADETELAIDLFPKSCPFAEADVLTDGWLPNL
ncbi:MAG: DUF29 domain-containing protein [Leptolyngbyaceae cyanobacterium SL_5_9]|nr:DUF29 domain-containing protein [Leptolyngbyaceae cyanobacterium SL_5_9]NJO76559.1 DUF29 domain-containing protein [Leptolyngbyaceae cyanobacterium RM1_406_9]